MRRLSALVVAPVVAALVLAGCTAGDVSEGIAAYSIGSRHVSQQSFDQELEHLAENAELRSVVEEGGGTLSVNDGSIVSELAAGWLTQVIALDVVARDRARTGLELTADDRARGVELAVQNVGGQLAYDALPQWLRERIASRWSNVAALQRELLASPDVEQALREQCPSGRYVSHILVATEAEAEEIAAELERGADFAQLAQQRSTDAGSAAQGGQLGCAEQGFVEPFQTVAATQPAGEVSDPVQTEFGFHLILVSDEPPAAELDRVTLDAVFARARGADVEVDPRYGTWDRVNGQVIPPGA